MSRNVRCGLIQASTALGGNRPLPEIKKAMIDKHLKLIEQAAKNLSYQRAAAVRQAYLEYCKQNGIKVDESQFLAVGVGTKSPKFPVPQTEEQWNANRRVVFRVKAVETELDSLKPAGK